MGNPDGLERFLGDFDQDGLLPVQIRDEENLFVKDIEKLLKFSREHHGMDIPMDLITSDGLRKFVHEMRLKKVYSLSDLKLIQLGQHADHETLCQIMKKDMSPHMKEIRTHFE